MENKIERKPRDYKNGKIYCLRNYANDKIYIGSTCQSLSKRMAYHRQDSIKPNRQRTLLYKTMTELGRDNFYIELIEDYPCENLSQLTKREGELTRELKASLNQKIAGRTLEEYQVECKDKIKKSKAIRDKKYRESNSEKKKELDRKYVEKNKEKIKVYQSEYYQKNRDRILEKQKAYCEKKTI